MLTTGLAELPELLAQAHVPGVAVALVQPGEPIATTARGKARHDAGVADDTLFQAASLSKPVFAYAVLDLVRQGTLDLDRPLADYGGEPFVADDALLAHVTARHVLSHTTGWPNWRPKGEALPREAPPGERYGYSGEGFVYLQRTLEHVTGQSLEALTQARVLKPFDMRHSSFVWPAADAPELATGHNAEGTPLASRRDVLPNAAFSLHTTATDLARFVSALLQDDHLGMLEPQVQVNRRVSWALGWGLESGSSGGRAFWHWGDNPGFKSFAIGLLEAGTGAVVMTNGDGGRPLCAWVVQQLLGTDHPALVWLARRYATTA